jgi:flavin reductase (DIM6/NTAB) family NADH-FMN oxidoreductase RutF
MHYDPRREPHKLAHSPLTALVVPRPIGWISTIGPGGIVNLAPYSFFNMVSAYPPFLIFAGGPRKHSQTNAETNGEFVFNMATYELKDPMLASSAEFRADVSEADAVGLEMVASHSVRPPRVARSPVAMECKYYKSVELIGSDGRVNPSTIVIGEVVRVHIDDSLIVDGIVDIRRARPLARLGYMDYCTVDEQFAMMPPADPNADSPEE